MSLLDLNSITLINFPAKFSLFKIQMFQGIWGWVKDRKDQNEPITLYIDTEGFFALNIADGGNFPRIILEFSLKFPAHDAKVFAVATLFSSQLIYNTKGTIDQSDVEYLQ